MKQAGLTAKQLEESLGRFNVSKINVQATGFKAAHVEAARVAVRQLQEHAVIISAKYNTMSRNARRDAREVATKEELATDRQLLDELVVDEYRMTNPFGKIEGKTETINKVLSGTIRPDAFGSGGFEALETLLQMHGDDQPNSVVLQGRFFFGGSGLVKFKGGRQAWRKLTGEYRTTHTFAFRDGRWKMTASQMTRVPDDPPFLFVGEKDTK
jgi:hypothetical protein